YLRSGFAGTGCIDAAGAWGDLRFVDALAAIRETQPSVANSVAGAPRVIREANQRTGRADPVTTPTLPPIGSKPRSPARQETSNESWINGRTADSYSDPPKSTHPYCQGRAADELPLALRCGIYSGYRSLGMSTGGTQCPTRGLPSSFAMGGARRFDYRSSSGSAATRSGSAGSGPGSSSNRFLVLSAGSQSSTASDLSRSWSKLEISRQHRRAVTFCELPARYQCLHRPHQREAPRGPATIRGGEPGQRPDLHIVSGHLRALVRRGQERSTRGQCGSTGGVPGWAHRRHRL